MSLDINYCRLCLQKTEGSAAETLSRDSKTFTLVTSLFPDMDTSIVINSMFCKECIEYAQLANLMIETVTKNEQKIVLDLQNTQLFELITCRLCLNNEKLEVAVYLFKNTNEAARHVIEIAIINLDFDLFRKPVVCNSCWQIVKSIYLFKKKCFTSERILKCYCATNGIISLDRKELEIVSLSYQEKMFSENLDEDNFLFDVNARSIANSNLTQNIVDPQNMYLSNLSEDKDVFEEVPYITNILNVKSESLKEEDEIEIKEEKLCEFIESDENVGMAADTMNLECIGRIQQTEKSLSDSETLINKTENMENICHSIQKKNQQIHVRNRGSEHRTHLSLKCEQCPYKTTDEGNMELHLKAHQSETRILKCSECYYITTCSNSLKNHMETHASKPKTFKCQKCDYVTRKHSNLVSHKLSHQENYNFKCEKCSYKAKRKSNLVNHMLIHEENYKFQCHECSYQTKRRNCLVRHMSIHQDNCKFQCHVCSYKAKRKDILIQHMLIHEENFNYFKCEKCNYQAKRKPNLVKHMFIHQENCIYFKCQKCSFQTKKRDYLVKHMLIHQKNYSFKCQKCSYQAKKRDYLVKHMLIHQENYNFKCEKCSYQAKRKGDLANHMLIHQENYNFKCQKCSYKAKRKYHLVRHMLIHQDKCNFQCHRCNYQTQRKADLIPHMLTHQIIEGLNA